MFKVLQKKIYSNPISLVSKNIHKNFDCQHLQQDGYYLKSFSNYT